MPAPAAGTCTFLNSRGRQLGARRRSGLLQCWKAPTGGGAVLIELRTVCGLTATHDWPTGGFQSMVLMVVSGLCPVG